MEEDSPAVNWLKVSELILGEVIMALGLVAVVGSYTVDINLLEVVAPFLPTEYNAALGFILCGLGLLAIGIGSARVAIASGLAGLIGLVVVYFGIDLPTPELQVGGSSPLSGSLLVIGLVTAFLLALAIHLAQTARLYGKQARSANEKLEDEISERKRTEERVQLHVERLRALHEIGQAITSSLEVGAVLDILIDKIGSLLPNLVTEIWLLNRESRQLEQIACGNLDKEEWMRRKLEKTPPLLKAVLMKKASVFVSNVQTDPRILDPKFFRKHGLVSYQGVPLVAKGEILGVITFMTREEHQFSKEESEFLSTLAGEASIAIHNSQLYEATKEQAVELERANENLKTSEAIQKLLKEFSQDITTLDIDGLLKKLTEKVREFFQGDICDVRLIEGGEWQLRGISGIDPNQIPDAWGSNLRRSLWIVENRRPLMIPDITKEGIREAGKALGPLGIQGYLGVPIVSRQGEVIGVLRVLTYQTREFSQEEIDFLQQLANGAAIAFDNTKLFEQTKVLASLAARDLVKRQQAEEELRSFAAKLERSNRELQDFASVASHDLQEPLRKIHAFGDRLKNKFSDSLGDEGCNYLGRMENAVGRMQILINDLLTLSRVTTKAQPFVSVDLAEVALGVLSDLEVRIQQTSGRVDVSDLPTIDADPLQMRQLLQNLIANALKFHRKEEAPVVKVHCQIFKGQKGDTAEEHPNDGNCQIIVEDNGIGFDEKYVDRIFAVFQRLNGRGDYEGSGVGLAVCRKIAERHGGEITAESKPGDGATFVVKLPMRHLEEEEAA